MISTVWILIGVGILKHFNAYENLFESTNRKGDQIYIDTKTGQAIQTILKFL